MEWMFIMMVVLASLLLICGEGGLTGVIILKCWFPGCPIWVGHFYQNRHEVRRAKEVLFSLPHSNWIWFPSLGKKHVTNLDNLDLNACSEVSVAFPYTESTIEFRLYMVLK
jgi:hypothetical protein